MKRFVKFFCHAVVLITCVLTTSSAQVQRPSIHQLESDTHRNDAVPPPAKTEAVSAVSPLLPRTQAVTKKVFGYHPYWVSSLAYLTYDFSALTTIGYFSYEVDATTGGYTTIHDWSTTPLIAYAHQRGVKVVLVATLFDATGITTILTDTVKQNTMITTMIGLLTARGGDGVNIDFEGVPAAQRSNLVSFMRRLATRVKAANPDAEISMASPAVDWSNAWDLASLSSICDYLVLMGYDYYWSTAPTAGPVSPLVGESSNVTKSVATYLGAGVAPEKLLLGLAWYGYDWPVTSNQRKAVASSAASDGTYGILEPMAQLNGKQFDATTKTPWFNYQSGTQWHQVWYDDSLSLSYKYGLVNSQKLGGIGLWALSYDQPRPELWQGVRASFRITSVAQSPAAPAGYVLEQNYPNPFNPTTVIRYTVPARAFVSLKLFDVLGKEVMALVDETKSPGTYEVSVIADRLPSGMYFCRMTAGVFVETKKLVLQR
jgi:spore germination protein YaaH